MTGHVIGGGARFPPAKFRPTTLPGTLVSRSELFRRLDAGAGHRLTLVVGPAGVGKSILLSSWAAPRRAVPRRPGVTSWLSCDEGDVNPVRFWAGLIESVRMVAPWFGADAAELLAMDNAMSADVTASIAWDAAKLPAGSAVIVDDFHIAAASAAIDMADLVERWPAEVAQLVLAARSDPPLQPLRLQRLRMAEELCELRDRDLYFSLAESRDLLAGFGVRIGADELMLLHQRSEGWTAAVQMAALSLRGTTDPVRVARALEVHGHAIAEYFIREVLDQQPPELAQFMLDTCVLGELTTNSCTAVTGREDAAALLRTIAAANLFLVALDDEQVSFRYHRLVGRLLRDELLDRDPVRERELQLRAGEWFDTAGDTRQAIRHFLAAGHVDRALPLLADRLVPEFLSDPAMPAPLEAGMIDASVLAPDRLLAVAADLLLAGDVGRGGQYLDLLERLQPPIPSESRLWARVLMFQSVRHALTGQAEQAVTTAVAARSLKERTHAADQWNVAAPMILPTMYTWLEDFPAAEREATEALGIPELSEAVKLVMLPGVRALAWFEAGRLNEAAGMAEAAYAQARLLGFEWHFFAVDYLRTLAGLALERRDFDTAEEFTERALSIAERRRPMFEFLALLDRAQIWAARGQVREALSTVETARTILAGTGSVLLKRADELEASLRLSLGEVRAPVSLAGGLPSIRRGVVLASAALASGDHQAAAKYLGWLPVDSLTPRRALVRGLLLAATAIERGDPLAAGVVGNAVQSARDQGYRNTVVSVAPQITSYLIEHAARARRDPFNDSLVNAALDVRAAAHGLSRSGGSLADPLTAAELRILRLLPTSTYQEIADILRISHNTVKTHLRSVYQKLGVESRSQAVERAVDLRLL